MDAPPTCPSGDVYRLFTDGGARGNPGPAGGGVVLLAPDGREFFAGGFFFGRTTNNQAEYQAIVHGMRQARRLGIRRLVLLADSELAVRQLQGSYRVKSANLRPLVEQALDLLGQFEQAGIEHISRERNSRADWLANRAMDAGADVIVTPGP